jgi:8-oxo-dGTP pyrophosphatase MutT (NUDIX family)
LIARGLITDENGRRLIVRAPGGTRWQLPGGLVGHGESPQGACAREVSGELGIDVTPGPLIAVEWTAPSGPGRPALMTLVFDLGEHDEPELRRVVRQRQALIAEWDLVHPAVAITRLHSGVTLALSAYRSVDPTAVYVEHHPAHVPGPDHGPRDTAPHLYGSQGKGTQ